MLHQPIVGLGREPRTGQIFAVDDRKRVEVGEVAAAGCVCSGLGHGQAVAGSLPRPPAVVSGWAGVSNGDRSMRDATYIDLAALKHLARGLTFDCDQIVGVADHALQGLNDKTGFPDRMRRWIADGAHDSGPCPLDPAGRIIIDVEQRAKAGGNQLYTAMILRKSDEQSMAPVMFLSMHSPTLDIPMRVELPLRAVLKGNAPLEGTYTLYLHALMTSEGDAYLYYGVTKRGWGLRFDEHTKAALAKKSKRLLARTLNALVEARAEELYGGPHDRPKLAGIVSTILGTGLSREAAMEAEERVVDKYSLASKHPLGLNMIPGGLAGIRHARRYFRQPNNQPGAQVAT